VGALPAGHRRALGLSESAEPAGRPRRSAAEASAGGPSGLGAGRDRERGLTPSRWRVERERGAPRFVFERPWPDPAGPTVWVVEATAPAVVLGSTQADSVLAPGVGAVRRRSGGGAVLVEPGGLVWVDVLVPAGDRLWEEDVGRAFAWLGRAWLGALADVGVAGADAYDGPLVTNGWSSLVCFAGLGPGEVTVDGAKVVGMCQRRTRAGALFQCAALRDWRPRRLLDRLALTEEDRERGARELAGVARGLPVDPAALVGAFLARLP
jgi:lipoate-protein ligase A